MVGISLTGPKVNPKAFIFDAGMFRMSKSVQVLVIIILMMLTALYVRFW